MRRKISGIYKITSPSGKVYIGQSIDVLTRWTTYRRMDCKDQGKLYKSFKSHGVDKHKFEIICECDISQLNIIEPYYIELFQSMDIKRGLNLKCGGDSKRLSQETKDKISLAKKGKKLGPFSEEHRMKIGLAHKGKPKKPEAIAKFIKTTTGRKQTPEHIEKVRLKCLGRVNSEETRKKISIANKGRPRTQKQIETIRNVWLGKKLPDEIKKKISNSLKGRVVSEETIAKIIKANTGRKASEATRKKISEALKKRSGPNSFLGKKHTDEAKEKMKAYWAKRREEKLFLN